MRPRNKREKEVVALSKKLREGITDAQTTWLQKCVIGNRAYCTSKSAWCTSCGQTFDVKTSDYVTKRTIECPHCHKPCEVMQQRRTAEHDYAYIQIITKCHGWQVLRYYFVRWQSRKGQPRRINVEEVMQKWCKPNTKMVTLGANLNCFPYRCSCPYSFWNMDFSVKEGRYHEEWMRLSIYPRKRILDIYKKLGVDGTIPDNMCAEDLFGKVFSNPFTEMLYKKKQYWLLNEALRDDAAVHRHLESIRVALRHHFVIESLIDYLDYLDILKRLKKDLHNPKYVAPADWDAMHEAILLEYHQKLERERRERMRRDEIRRINEMEEKLLSVESLQPEYAKRIAKYAGLQFSNGTIDVRPLMSIQEFADEGREMHHCVFLNEYYLEKDSLILSAKIDGKRIETIEIDLKDFDVVQSRGKYNCKTEYHDDIMALCFENMPLIKSLSGKRHKLPTKVKATA